METVNKLKIKALHILLSDYKLDSRVRNETESLSESTAEVTVFCLRSKQTPRAEIRNGVHIERYGLFCNHKILLMFTAYVRFFLAARSKNFTVVHAHDFTALPIAFLIAKIMKIPLIYDSHELWSESEHEKYPQFIINLAYYLEKFFAQRADRIITVSDSINHYLQKYFHNQMVSTVRNIPSYTFEGESHILREQYFIPDDVPIFIYVGSLSQERGVDLILIALSKLTNLEFKFVFLGDGPYSGQMRKYIKEHNLTSKVFLSSAVPQNDLIKYIKSADIGVHAIPNTCLNHDYCLPNKLFEYIHAGVGVLCTGLTEMSHLINTYQIGMTFEDKNPADLAEKISHLIINREEIDQYKMNARRLAKSLTWENEFQRLKMIYDDLHN